MSAVHSQRLASSPKPSMSSARTPAKYTADRATNLNLFFQYLPNVVPASEPLWPCVAQSPRPQLRCLPTSRVVAFGVESGHQFGLALFNFRHTFRDHITKQKPK